MNLGDGRVRFDDTQAVLGNPGVFKPSMAAAYGQHDAVTDALRGSLVPPTLPLPDQRDLSELPMERDLAAILATLLRIEAHLTRPRWYQRLWPWVWVRDTGRRRVRE